MQFSRLAEGLTSFYTAPFFTEVEKFISVNVGKLSVILPKLYCLIKIYLMIIYLPLLKRVSEIII